MALVTIECRDAVAILTIDNPPVNALTRALRASLLEALRTVADDRAIAGAVLRCAGRTFVAGADIRELDRGVGPPHTPQIVACIDDMPKPVVAALHGTALGGGLEVALACHARVAAADAAVGFPEVRLGLLPGAGGTQRLPRLIGADAALEIMLSGAPVPAPRAHALGIVDAIAAGNDLLEAAIAQVLTLAEREGGLPRIRDLPAPDLAATSLEPDRERSMSGPFGGLAPRCIVQSVENASRLSFDAAVAAERALFLACLASDESKALRHAFFAERDAMRRPRRTISAGAPRIERVAVIGAGTMGVGIAYSLLEAGLEVVLHDVDGARLERCRSAIDALAGAAERKARLTPAAREALLGRLELGSSLSAAASADLVIEAVFENLPLKREIFAQLDAICAEQALLASNTSTLDIDALAASTRRPQSVLGLHFFSPAQVMRLIEIVPGASTSDAAIDTARSLAKRLDKIGVVVGNAFGFVGNRMYHSYSREAQRLLLEGASPGEIDAALVAWGMAMGPHAVADLAGLDVGYRIRRERSDRRDDPAYFRVADALVEAGRLGQKSGRGIYRYEAGSRAPLPDADVAALIAREAADLGIERRVIHADEIVERCIHAMIVEGARALEARVARSAADIDVIWLNGYGFPRSRGGPMFFADRVGLAKICATVRGYCERFGPRYWETPPVLEDLAQRGGSFGFYRPD